jgi:hypothetical protein
VRRVVSLVTGCASAPGLSTADVVMEEFRVINDPGIQVYVRNKHPAGMTQFSAAKTVIFVHGATYPAETAFDLRLDGVSCEPVVPRSVRPSQHVVSGA